MKKTIIIIVLFAYFLSAVPTAVTSAEKPQVKFLSPQNNAVWLGKLEIKIGVTNLEPSAIKSVELFLDGRLLKQFQAPPYTLTYDFGQQTEFRKLKVVVRDVNQNIYTKEMRSEFFDDTQEVNIVQVVVPVAVMDYKGNYISNLTKEDFIIEEDGVRQEIDYFSKSGRTKFNLVLLIDISSSMKNKIGKVKEAARLFLKELLGSDDRAIIVLFNHDVFEDTDFTNDIDELFNSISVAFPFGATALYDAVAYCIKLLKGISGRNIIILFSDGEDNSSYIDPYTLIKKAEQSNSVIYAIGKNVVTYEDNQYQALLKKISTSSGGMTFFFDKVEDVEQVYRKIRRDIRAKYILQFSPKDDKKRKRFRKLTVKIKGRKKYTVRTIKGYYY